MSLPIERILQSILVMRGEKVMLDANLAAMYGVETGARVRAVKRTPERFPSDFMFQVGPDECSDLKGQLGISNARGGRRTAPYAFAEQGEAMLSSVLHSDRALMEPPVKAKQLIGFRSRP